MKSVTIVRMVQDIWELWRMNNIFDIAIWELWRKVNWKNGEDVMVWLWELWEEGSTWGNTQFSEVVRPGREEVHPMLGVFVVEDAATNEEVGYPGASIEYLGGGG